LPSSVVTFGLNGAVIRVTVLVMSIDQIAAEALRLPAKERALLAESLWESLADPNAASAGMDESASVALAVERDQQIESGQVQAVSHHEMMARLRR
jgi:putative addiction module component (TIGR02574 family)